MISLPHKLMAMLICAKGTYKLQRSKLINIFLMSYLYNALTRHVRGCMLPALQLPLVSTSTKDYNQKQDLRPAGDRKSTAGL